MSNERKEMALVPIPDKVLVGIPIGASEYIVVYNEKVVEKFRAVGAKAAQAKRKKRGTLYIRVGDE